MANKVVALLLLFLLVVVSAAGLFLPWHKEGTPYDDSALRGRVATLEKALAEERTDRDTAIASERTARGQAITDAVKAEVTARDDVIAQLRADLVKPKPGEVRQFEIAKGVWMKFCWIPPGKATLGSSEKLTPNTRKAFEYSATGFWLGKYPVTQEEWTAVSGSKPFIFQKTNKDKPTADLVANQDISRFPAEYVSWEEVQDFLTKINKQPGKDLVFGKSGKFCLPHEDMWEYACRGGWKQSTAYFWGNTLTTQQGNFNKTLRRPSAVGIFESAVPHPWGLCDMAGNVWQICGNNFNEKEDARVVRGGSWNDPDTRCRTEWRDPIEPKKKDYSVGFRVCFSPE
jgi:formylglycine-generating enzyme required for sulfatase activity